MKKRIKLGTRGSALALCQAEMTEAALALAWPDLEVERVVITTTGDRRTDVSLKDVAKAEGTMDKGVFIKELEVALEKGEVDFAVHSLKDVPTVLEGDFSLAAFLERAPVRDCLISRTPDGLAGLPANATVATGSVRRARQLKHLRPDVTVVDMRGNVPTRLEKLAKDGKLDAIMLAEAGLRRLQYEIDAPLEIAGVELHVTCLDEDTFFPAAGQGAVAIEVNAGDRETADILAEISHSETASRVTAEREFLRLLDAGCHTPVGVWSVIEGGEISLGARLFDEHSDAPPVHAEVRQPLADAVRAGAALFEAISNPSA